MKNPSGPLAAESISNLSKNNFMGFVNWMKLQKNEFILGIQFFNHLQQLTFKFIVL